MPRKKVHTNYLFINNIQAGIEVQERLLTVLTFLAKVRKGSRLPPVQHGGKFPGGQGSGGIGRQKRFMLRRCIGIMRNQC